MKTAQDERLVATVDLKRLIRHAWYDLQRANRDGDLRGMQRAERKMSALLDRL